MNRLVPEDYARLSRFSSLVLSRGGAAAWVRFFWEDGAWQRRVEINAGGETKTVSAGGSQEKCPAFSPDGQLLWFLSDGKAAVHSLITGETKVRIPSLPDGFEAEDVLPLSDGCLITCRKERREMPPDGCGWAMPLVTEELHFRYDADHGFKKKYDHRLYRYDGKLRLIAEAEKAFSGPVLLPDESAVLYGQGRFRLLDLSSLEDRELPSPFHPAGDTRPVVSKDGTYALAAVRTEGEEIVLRRVWLDGQEHPEDETVDEPAGLAHGAYMDQSPEHRYLIAPADAPDTFFACCADGYTPGLWRVAVSSGRIGFEKISVPGLVTEAAGWDGQGILMLLGGTQAPPAPARIRGGEPVFLSPSHNAWLSEMEIAPYLPVSVPSQDGRAVIQGFLLLPKTERKDLPLLVWVHGGPAGYWAPGFDLEVQCAVSRGFSVLLPNPRGSTGRGNAYADAEHAFDGGAANDILCLLDQALREYPFLDGKRVSVLGGSYGGFMAAWLAGTTARFQCAVVIKAVTNWLFIHFNSSQAGQPVFDDFRDFQDFLTDTVKASPVYFAQDVNIPTLIIHGEQDQQVPAENAHQYYTALKDCHPDLPVRLMLVPDACHRYSLDALPDYIAIQRETLKWLELYGKGENH